MGSRMGRPPSSAPRSRRITLCLTEAEHAALTEARGDTPEAVYAREAVVARVEIAEPDKLIRDLRVRLRNLRRTVRRLAEQVGALQEVIGD